MTDEKQSSQSGFVPVQRTWPRVKGLSLPIAPRYCELNNKTNQKSRRAKTSKRRGNSAHPPPFRSTIGVSKVFRFVNGGAAGTYPVTFQDLGDLWCVATAANVAYQLSAAVRVSRVEVWGPMSSTLVPVTTSIEWAGLGAGSVGSSMLQSDTSMGSASCAHVNASPTKSSAASLWQAPTNTGVAFTLILPANAIVDVHLSLTVRETGVANTVTGAVAGATAGINYVRALSSTTTTALAPVSYLTI